MVDFMTEMAEIIAPPHCDPGRDAVLLDFDGTLVEIAPRPDAVVVPAGLQQLVNGIPGLFGGAVAIVSGRSLAELETFLPEFTGSMIGSHGAEWRGRETTVTDILGDLHQAVQRFADANGLLAEPKPHGAAIHFRQRPDAAQVAQDFADTLARTYAGFVVQPAKMAFEIRPEGATKDAALTELFRRAPFAGRRPIYLGDDTTDEPALRWAGEQGGFGIKVGDGDSVAQYRLGGPTAVIEWLSRMASQEVRTWAG